MSDFARTTRIYFILVIAMVASVPAASFAQTPRCNQSKCAGKAPADHNHGDYHFLTKSRVYQDGNDHIYETCVQNLGSNDLEVNWVIPGPESVVLKGCALSNPRPFSSRVTIDTYSGCLRYGANWDWKRAPFLPHKNDLKQIEAEGNKDCRDYHVADADLEESQVRDIVYSVERFGSSIHGDFSSTLTRIDFTIEISTHPNDGVFVTTLSAAFSPAYEKHSAYYNKGFTIRPSDDSLKQGMLAEASGNPNGGYFAEKGSFQYALPIPEKPIQSFIRYAVFSYDEKRVASVDVPIWVNSE